jgi:hypothetical protein
MSTARILNCIASFALIVLIWPLDVWRFVAAVICVFICEMTQWHMGKNGEDQT